MPYKRPSDEAVESLIDNCDLDPDELAEALRKWRNLDAEEKRSLLESSTVALAAAH